MSELDASVHRGEAASFELFVDDASDERPVGLVEVFERDNEAGRAFGCPVASSGCGHSVELFTQTNHVVDDSAAPC